MKISEMYANFAKCVKMIEDGGVTIKPYSMLKFNGKVCTDYPVAFYQQSTAYTFALGIIDNTPIFVGDTVYHSIFGKCVVSDFENGKLRVHQYGMHGGMIDHLGQFSLKCLNEIEFKDIKAFEIFKYKDEEVMVIPASNIDSIERFTLSGLCKDFGKPFSFEPKTKEEMYEYLTNTSQGTDAYIKTNKRFGLIEE